MKKVDQSYAMAGVWLDQNKAYLIFLDGKNEPELKRINSEVESRVRIPGEGKVFARFGNAFLDDQEKKQRRQQLQRRRYFDTLLKELGKTDFIFLFGPGKGKEELYNRMVKKPAFRGKVVYIETTDRLTKNQMLEKTQKFFSSKFFQKLKKTQGKNSENLVTA